MSTIPKRALSGFIITGADIADGTIGVNDMAPAAQAALKGTDKRLEFPTLTCSFDGVKLSNTALPDTPFPGSLIVKVNTVEQTIGDGVKTTDMYFSADGGQNARLLKDIQAGDVPYFNAVIANMQVVAGDAAYAHYRY